MWEAKDLKSWEAKDLKSYLFLNYFVYNQQHWHFLLCRIQRGGDAQGQNADERSLKKWWEGKRWGDGIHHPLRSTTEKSSHPTGSQEAAPGLGNTGRAGRANPGHQPWSCPSFWLWLGSEKGLPVALPGFHSAEHWGHANRENCIPLTCPGSSGTPPGIQLPPSPSGSHWCDGLLLSSLLISVDFKAIFSLCSEQEYSSGAYKQVGCARQLKPSALWACLSWWQLNAAH